MNMIKCSSIVKVIKNFRKSITTNVNTTDITSCLEELAWTLKNKRVLFPTDDVSVYLLHTLFIVKNVVEKNYFFNVQDNLHKNLGQLVCIFIDSILLWTLSNTINELEIASQISMIIESYVHGFQNTLTVFRNIEHISDQLMATNHTNIIDILKLRFPQCFDNPIDVMTSEENTSDDLNTHFSDQLYFTSHEVLTMDDNLTVNEHQNIVPECNMSYDELIMYMDAPHDDNSDIPWLTSFQIRSQSQMKSKKKRTFGFQDNNHTFNCKPCNVDLTNINKLKTTISLKRQNTDDCFKDVESKVSEDANEIKKPKQSPAGIEKPKKKRIRKPTLYCWDCHSIIKRKTQYCCVQCHRLYHKLCFKTTDLICLDCDMSMRMEYEDPETLALILKNTMDKVLNSESSDYLGMNKFSVNLLYVSLKVDNKKYFSIPDFLSDIKFILHICSITKKYLHLKEHAETIMEIVLKDLKAVTMCKKKITA